MTTQLELGEALKEQGQARATDAAQEWHDAATTWMFWLIPGTTFTADDLVLSVGLPNLSAMNKNNAVGAAFTAARRTGLIRRTGWQQSTRPESHGRVVAVWTRN